MLINVKQREVYSWRVPTMGVSYLAPAPRLGAAFAPPETVDPLEQTGEPRA